VHGLFYFFIQKFAETRAEAAPPDACHVLRARIEGTANYLPEGSCPDSEAVGLLNAVSTALGEPVDKTHAMFGEYVAHHLIRMSGERIDRSWRTLELVEHADHLIRAMVHDQQDSSLPPVFETVRISPTELHLVYTSPRKMCSLAAGAIRGVAAHFGETIGIEESACMHRGNPFCSFVIRNLGTGSSSGIDLASAIATVPGTAVHRDDDPGLAHDRDRDDDLPTRIGPYPVLRSIAHGSMGHVYLAHDEQLGRPVAVKVMRRSWARRPEARQRFIREGRALASISHPHVVTVYGVGEHDGQPYLVMEHLDGLPLSALPRPVPPPVALRIGREIASGLAAAHARGLIHRDIKPQNIILEGPEHNVRIIDFGLAREADRHSPFLTTDGVVVGTPAYLSPECLGKNAVDGRADVFGLGVVLYELLSGRLPYEGDSALAMLASIARGEPLPLAQVAPATPPEICTCVMRMMAHQPEQRPTDAYAVEAELGALEKRLIG
jgi:serine/threonine-protein kinase